MIEPPPGWTRSAGIGSLLFHPPAGREAGQLRYRERLAPLRSLNRLVADELGADPGFILIESGRRETLTTSEGEHALWVAMEGELGGRRCRRFTGAVFAEDFANLVDVIARHEDHFRSFEQLFREVLVGVKLGLGVRRRRYLYTPPPGWQALGTGLVANWYPPDYPKNRTNLVVYPANPSPDNPDAVFAQVLHAEELRGHVLERCVGPTEVRSAHGLSGSSYLLTLRTGSPKGPMFRGLVVLRRAPYLYSMQLMSFDAGRLEEHQRILLDVVRSAHPVGVSAQPAPSRGGAPDADVMGHWL